MKKGKKDILTSSKDPRRSMRPKGWWMANPSLVTGHDKRLTWYSSMGKARYGAETSQSTLPCLGLDWSFEAYG